MAVNDVSFEIEVGELSSIIGPNGAGKTTLFNLLTGHLRPEIGGIFFKEKEITGLSPHEICRKGIVRTFQAGNLFGNMNALDNVLLGAFFGSSARINWPEGRQEAAALLELVGLAEKKTSLAKDLTIAAQKRLEIARALATKPKLLLLDEVMAGLNAKEIDLSLQLISRIRARGITIFMIEHVMKAIMGISERVLVLHHGEKIAEGTPKEIVSSDTVIKVYLGE